MIDKFKALEGLNEKQKEAVLYTEGPVLIVAGAGSGKTRTLTHRVAYLLATGIKPDSILAITFTNKAAEEMRERIKQILGENNFSQKLFIGTFHKLGVNILKDLLSLVQRRKNFVIFDEEDSLKLIRDCLAELNLPKEQFIPVNVRNEISRAKNELILSKDYEQLAENFFQKNVAKAYSLYEEKLIKNNAFDFDDLITLPVQIFSAHPDILEKYQNKWRYILVDEYQDTNTSQYQLIKLLASKYRNICVVGDEDQSIYSWRQADFRNFLNFEKDWPDAKIIILETSYRLTKNILAAAQEVIKNNKLRRQKTLISPNQEGRPVFVVRALDDIEEAEFVASMIQNLVRDYHYQYKDFAVLYRMNAQSRVLEEVFLKARIPYQIFAGVKFYQRKEIKDIIAYLRILANPADLVSLERVINVPSRGIGQKKIESIFKDTDYKKVWQNIEKFSEAKDFLEIYHQLQKDAEKKPVAHLIKELLEKIDYQTYLKQTSNQAEEKWQNILELVRLAEDFDEYEKGDLNQFLEKITLFQEGDEKIGDRNYVSLMTLHSAKGLEFNIVFIVGVEEGILPHAQSQYSDDEMEEERRLIYVGMTRAKDEIYLIWSSRRRIFGNLQMNTSSRFLDEIPPDLKQEIELDAFQDELDEEKKKIDPDNPDIELFDDGEYEI
ncbi:MAG TPA: UvrD-helicase domain-containing protein [Candidatus Paceibacterota bacterium]|nr:UvrD-helicase domain-containing protein [Candidatus Paceibacterota bacterium]HOL54216.1 UvrD-helicase domain-containing protein [Candidatus Paceibacterota bacterium]HPP17224.1 UvrD-helicase domain-containing protein [Candidatus Paceibacterota bacterium]